MSRLIVHSISLLIISLAPALASVVSVTVDTTGLSGTTGDLVFEFTGGGGPSGNTASILNFTTDGTLGSVSATGDVTRTLPGEVDLTVDNSSVFFSDYLTGFTYGTSVAFTLSTTQIAPGVDSSPDEFALFLLASDGATSLIQTSDPTSADSLLTFDIDGSRSGVPTVFTVTSPDNVSATMAPGTTGPMASTPEPSMLGLLVAGFCGFFARGTGTRRTCNGMFHKGFATSRERSYLLSRFLVIQKVRSPEP